MPELPEVETTRRGIAPHLLGHRVTQLLVHEPRLRWPVPDTVSALENATITAVSRRAKYLLLTVPAGSAIVHLGMSGSLRFCTDGEPRRKHDHVEMTLSSGGVLRFHDPRRFGCLLWQAAGDPPHPLLAKLGPEPLSDAFDGDTLFAATRKRAVAIKILIMNAAVVVGVGNIYASEALFAAGVRPGRAARRVTRVEAHRIAAAIKTVLARSIEMGGTTLRDFVDSDGQPGYFAQSLAAYGRAGEPCRSCRTLIAQRVLGQRSTFWCPTCQR